ncbi:right-handed parallel beta-helix repeat-containing protein [Halobaculum limi]|uniref:right-handed parallel beta-helix repeat-containing protein n=1 Tax=Halobaculum limi TaxID=3031916 RepID=UPI002406C3CF|nr:right-handed parallel beta-helix repeat-containing protein [Halobaculum sp. YSMS11]
MPTTVSTIDELQSAVENAGPGSEIIARGGTYDLSSRWVVTAGGARNNPLVIRAADGETPHIRFDSGGRSEKDDNGIQFRSPHVHFVGFEVSGSGWKGVNTDGDADDVVFEDLDVHDCYVWGIMNNDCDNVTFRNCDSHHNRGNPGNADGFNMTGSAENGLIEGCRSWGNGDDGYDTWVSRNHTIRNCWAWDNGHDGGDGNGFKLGGGPDDGGGHLVHNCVAYDNSYRGFDWNTTDQALEIYNCTAVDNPVNYRFNENGPYTLRNNISVGGSVYLADEVDDTNNTWNLDISDPMIVSTDPTDAEFMQLQSDSPCIDAGEDVGLPFAGSAPDLGAFESEGQIGTGGGEEEPTDSTTLGDGETPLYAVDAETNSLFQTEHAGFTNEGYINFDQDSGAFARWQLDVETADQYQLEIRFANGGSGDRTANLTYAGTQQQITFPQTGGWTDWATMTESVELPSGSVELTIETTGQDAGNVDMVTIWPIQETEPSEPTTGDTTNHGFATPEPGQADWHIPLNENFEAIDRVAPVVDVDGAKTEYTPTERSLYIALDTGVIYVGDGSQWNQLGSLN